MDVARLNRCPRCGYRLEGLPSTHTCPECGLDYDPDCVVIPLRAWRRDERLLQVIVGVIVVGGVCLYPDLRVGFRWVLIPLTLVVGAVVYLRVRSRYGVHAVIINHRGVTFDTPALNTRFVSWNDIACARFDWSTESFHLEGREETQLLACKGEVIGGNGLAFECARRINAAKAVYVPS